MISVHLENLLDTCNLARIYEGNPRFDGIVVQAIFDYLPFLMDSLENFVGEYLLPERIFDGLEEMLRDLSPTDSQDSQANAICENLCDDFIRTGIDFMQELGVCEAFHSEMATEDFIRLVSKHLAQRQRRQRRSRPSSTQESANGTLIFPKFPISNPAKEVAEGQSSANSGPERDQVVPSHELLSISAPHTQSIQAPINNSHQSTPYKWSVPYGEKVRDIRREI